MNTNKIAYLLAFVLFFGVAFYAKAADDNRYLIKSTSGVWKKYFGVRHSFDNGFTTDLSDFQVRFSKIFGVEIEPVKKLYVLPVQADLLGEIAQSLSKPAKSTGKNQRLLPTDPVPWGIKMIYDDLFLAKTSGGDGVNVAVLDTGVLKTHSDLKNRIKDCKDFSSPRSPLMDGKCEDKNGHGTHVSGIIAADGGSDGLGIFGIVPDVNLYAYQVCSASGSCWADDVAFAIRTATDNGVNVINLSLGSDSQSLLIYNAVIYAVSKNVLVVAAAGNDGPYAGSIDYPAANREAVGVGALDVNKAVSDWSSRGVNSGTTAYVVEDGDIEFAAPGVSIESTWKDGVYAILSGTSMATPHVAGLAAKLWQKDALAPADATRDLLHKFSIDLLPLGDDNDSGWGISTL
ncbi:MAG: S8 family peptidase [Candidatus Yanofskybacteria bacterium]|nr:S8 family peptidase [Candidatus Yanofskybacteria bacterium]